MENIDQKKALLGLVFRMLIFPMIAIVSIFFFTQSSCFKNLSHTQKSQPKLAQYNKKGIPSDKKIINVESRDIEFPKNFFFGTASSDFQTTGGNGQNDWQEHILNIKPPKTGPSIGTDFLNRYKEDFNLAKEVKIQVHRLSLEWSRIEPKEGQWDNLAIKKYKDRKSVV